MAEKRAPKIDAKDVSNKLRFSNISPNVLIALSRVNDYGVEKYGADRGRDYIYGEIEYYIDALFRHYIDWKLIGSVDNESHLHHAEHMLWNMMAIIDLLVVREELIYNGSRKEVTK